MRFIAIAARPRATTEGPDDADHEPAEIRKLRPNGFVPSDRAADTTPYPPAEP